MRPNDLTRDAAAELILALTSADDKKALVSAALARTSLTKISEKYEKQAIEAWEEASKKALTLINLVRENNPKTPLEKILNRPDIKAVLRQPYIEAAQKSEKVLREAWSAAEKDAVQKVKGEFKLAGETWKGHEADAALLESLVADLYANAKGMRARASEAVESDEPGRRLRGITNDARTRARYSVSVGVFGVSSAVRESAFAAAGLNKMWVARTNGNGKLLPDVCSTCRGLHLTVVAPGEQFPKNTGDVKLGVYKGALYGPPRHPNCRCIVVGTKLKKSKT